MSRATRGVVTVALALGIAVAGCGEPDGARTGAGGDLTAAELGDLGGRIYAEPARAAELLGDAGLSREAFEARIREVSSDPEQAREYTEAFDAVVGRSAASEPEP